MISSNVVNFNKDDLTFIERCVGAIKENIDVAENLFKIERALNRVFDMNFNIVISDNDSGSFYGINIFPSIETMNSMVENIVEHKKTSEDIDTLWASTNEWFVEFDHALLYDIALGANPAEITALLLHEIGHVIFSNNIPSSLHSIFRFKMLGLNHLLKTLFVNKKIRKLLNIAITEACSTKNFIMSTNAQTDADKFVSYYGYEDALDGFIDKIIARYGNGMINRTVEDIRKDIEVIVNWTILNIKELEFRKTQLRSALKVEILKNPSVFIKKVIQDIYTAFFGDVADKYRELVAEQYMSNPTDTYGKLQSDQYFSNFVNKVLTEAASGKSLFDKNGRLKKITQSDIDVLYVESDNIKTVDDKIYLLDKTYMYLEMVNLGLDYISAGDKEMTYKVTQSKNTLNDMKNQLEKIRANILATKIIEKEWGTFVRAPKGYEG